MATVYKVLDQRDRTDLEASINQLTNKVYDKEANLQNNIDNLESRHEELKAYAENNKKLIDKLDEDKINYSDIVNTVNSELATSDEAAGVPLSAAQGGILYNRDQFLQKQINDTNDSIKTETTRATNIEAGLDIRLQTVEDDINAFLADAEFSEAAKDTLREIQDYINSDTSAASDMTSSIQANANAISAEVTRATGVESGLDDAIKAEESRALGIESGLNTRLTNVENNKVNTADIVNVLTSTATNVPLSAYQGKVLNDAKINYSDIVDAVSTDYIDPAENNPYSSVPLSVRAGSIAYNTGLKGIELAGTKINKTDIVDDLTTKDADTDYTAKVLSAEQGFVLKGRLDDIPAWSLESTKPTYTYNEVGADQSGTASSLVSAHNTATDSHSDIRESIETLTTAVEARVLKASIANNLTTDDEYKVLSAKQGVALKSLYDGIPEWALATNKPSYTYTEVGADAEGAATDAIDAHNSSTDAHSDIRQAVTNVSDALTERIPKTAIVDNLTTAQDVKVLSANQGVVLNGLIQELSDALDALKLRVDALDGGGSATE